MKVYLIVSSDETYKYILSRKDIADNVRNKFPDENFSPPEEITVDSIPTRPHGYLYAVTMNKNGDVEDISEEELIINYKDHYSPGCVDYDINGDLYIRVWASNENHAVSIVDSIRKELLSTNKWGSK